VTVLIVAQVTLPLEGIPCGESEAEKKALDKTLVETITKVVAKNLKPTQSIMTLEIISTGCETSLRRRGRRHLADTTTVKSDVDIAQVFTVSAGNEDTVDTTSVGNSIADQVGTTVNAEVASGAFVTTLGQQAVTNGVVLPAGGVSVSVASTTAKSVTSESINTNEDWYPDWSGLSGTCITNNGGSAPHYMESSDAWFEDSLKSCCKRYYEFSYSKCTKDAAEAIGYYPVFDGNRQSICVNDTNVPDHMRANPSQWVYSDVKSCCERHYSWAYNGCIVDSDSDGTITALGTNKWYVNYQKQVCKQDCFEGSDACGGLAKTWDKLFNTAADCCSIKLHWVDSKTCRGDSTT